MHSAALREARTRAERPGTPGAAAHRCPLGGRAVAGGHLLRLQPADPWGPAEETAEPQSTAAPEQDGPGLEHWQAEAADAGWSPGTEPWRGQRTGPTREPTPSREKTDSCEMHGLGRRRQTECTNARVTAEKRPGRCTTEGNPGRHRPERAGARRGCQEGGPSPRGHAVAVGSRADV